MKPDMFSQFKVPLGPSSIRLQIKLTGVTSPDDKAVFDSVYLLSVLSKCKPYIKETEVCVDKRHTKKEYEVFVEMRDTHMYNFIEYFIYCRFFYLVRTKYDIVHECVFMIRKYFFCITSNKFWMNLPDELLEFDCPIFMEFVFDKEIPLLPILALNIMQIPTLDKRVFDT